jgi:hypothetical protein
MRNESSVGCAAAPFAMMCNINPGAQAHPTYAKVNYGKFRYFFAEVKAITGGKEEE